MKGLGRIVWEKQHVDFDRSCNVEWWDEDIPMRRGWGRPRNENVGEGVAEMLRVLTTLDAIEDPIEHESQQMWLMRVKMKEKWKLQEKNQEKKVP